MSDPLDRTGDLYPPRAQIRKNRRAAQIADVYDLVREGPWVYSVVDGGDGPAGRHALVFEYLGGERAVRVPEELGGFPVTELYNKVFYDSATLERVELPNRIERIGLKVFARCPALREARLSDALRELDARSFQGCGRLSRVHLPASLLELDDRLLSGCPIARLEVGPALASFGWTSARHPELRELSVDPRNLSFSTDGRALYSRDGKTLVRLLVPTAAYALAPGCERVGDSACKNLRFLASVELGPSLREVGPFAFFGTSLSRLELPPSLRRIETRAFSDCSGLARVSFPEGLVEIGALAFCATGVYEARLPRTLRYLATDAFAKTPLVRRDGGSGAGALSIDPGNPRLVTDGEVLYERRRPGLVATGCFGAPARVDLLPGTVSVDTAAFAHQARLREATLPEGLATIGDRAFYSCAKLARADLPASLRSIGEEAFARTALSELRIGAALERIGARALVGIRAGAGSLEAPPQVSVDAGNPRFYLSDGVLCERGSADEGDDGGSEGGSAGACDTALLYTGPGGPVTIPDGVGAVAELAFMRAPITRLEIPATVRSIDPRAFNGLSALSELVICYDPPLEGRAEVALVFPGDANSAEGLARSLRADDDGRLFRFADYDEWAIQYWLLNKWNAGTVARMALARLDCPAKLSDGARERYLTCLRTILPAACKQFAKRRDFAAFARLEEHGLIHGANIDEVLRGSEEEGEAETTAYLLRLKKRKFGIEKRDFSL